jgi:hypothetical protein
MKIKKLLGTLVAGTAMLAIAVTASAATKEINIYGASAQFDFWNALASDFIKNQTGCSGATPIQKTYDSANKVTYATCGGNDYTIRVSSKASFDGILALKGDDSMASSGATKEKCSAGDPGDPGASTRAYYRKMADETSGSGTTASALKCVRVNLGASDVAGESFTQYTYGRIDGPATAVTTDAIERSFTGINTTGIASAQPFVVPFAFFANTGNATLNTAMNDNITRMQAVLLFSGQVTNWQDLGSSYPNLHTVLCLRHAGSGTHSTLDYAVVKGNGWGSGLASAENRPDDTGSYDSSMPDVYFNDGTTQMLNCLNGQTGAIGYADADKADFTTHVVSGKAVKAIKYQGEYASREAIKNGRYDFWTNEWAYKDSTYTDSTFMTALLTFAADPSKIPTSKTNFWAVQSEMKYEKATDQAYPSKL